MGLGGFRGQAPKDNVDIVKSATLGSSCKNSGEKKKNAGKDLSRETAEKV